jgi:glycosidase
VPHHALVGDYTKYGISNDDPDVVKGRAGSPYAVKDYYNVDPDLAADPKNRLKEFESLIQRTHKNGMKVIIDIVPNHVARKYEGKSNPPGVRDFGATDKTAVAYDRNNDFYYIPGHPFEVPTSPDYKPLGGQKNPLVDGKFRENPAKWTGNNVRSAKPDINDWYETAKINYGVSPDGHKDFPSLPDDYDKKGYREHYAFWQGKDVPDSWKKFRDIALYWIGKGVDGFRYDMAEMVPVEFWSYMNSAIKTKNPNAFLMAEVYNPKEYRNYIGLGKMDYLYDKVEFYDKLKAVVQGHDSPDGLANIIRSNADIERHLLHFVENHDEQRIASPEFAGSGAAGKPLMLLSATIGTSPVMLYFGQEEGEKGAENAGFGKPSRTSIFDYIGVPAHQRWMNGGKFDGGQLTDDERQLRDFYLRLLNFTAASPAIMGNYADLQTANRKETANYGADVFSFARWSDDEKLLVIANISPKEETHFDLKVPADVIVRLGLADGAYPLKEQLYGKYPTTLTVKNGVGTAPVRLAPSGSAIYRIEPASH